MVSSVTGNERGIGELSLSLSARRALSCCLNRQGHAERIREKRSKNGNIKINNINNNNINNNINNNNSDYSKIPLPGVLL